MPPSPEPRETKHGTHYVVRVRNPNRIRGRKPYTSATFATLPEAERFCRDYEDRGRDWALEEYLREQDEAQEMTLDDWAETHFKTLTRANAATVADYRRLYESRWSPALGQMRLSKIGRVHVAQALNEQTGADKTVMNAWSVLTHMLKMAAQDGHIQRSPALGVTPPRRTSHETQEHRYLTQAEFGQVLSATRDHYKPLVMMLAGTGMRWSELAALTVADVDLDAATVRIVKAEKRGAERRKDTTIGPTKTRKSKRTVALPGEVVEAVRPLTEGRKKSEQLFLPVRGGPLRHRRFYQVWQDTMRRSGIAEPYPRIHDLRHSHVAWLIAMGVPLPVIQARLGHESITTTADTYGHLLPDIQRAAADAANVVFSATPKQLG